MHEAIFGLGLAEVRMQIRLEGREGFLERTKKAPEGHACRGWVGYDSPHSRTI